MLGISPVSNAPTGATPQSLVNTTTTTITSYNQNAELAKPVTRVVYFVEFHFVDGTQRFSTLSQSVDWGGYTWLGLGQLGSIDVVEESASLTPTALNFNLNITQPGLLYEGVGAVSNYRGKVARMYFCPLNEQFQLIDTPVLCWTGIMDMMTVGISNEIGQIVLKCENSAFGLKRQQAFRMNAAQHKLIYPYDSGFDNLVGLISQPSLWLSKRFQQQP